MQRKLFLCLISVAALRADFKYDQTSRIEGGMLAGVLNAFGAAKKMNEAGASTVAYQGDRMVTRSAKRASIVDAARQTITEVDFDAKSYSVVTFAEMAAFMQKAGEKMKSSPAGSKNDVNLDMSIDLRDTGKTRNLDGHNAKEYLLSMKMVATDPQTGKAGDMRFEMSEWMAKDIPGAEDMRRFAKKMTANNAWFTGAGPAAAMGPQSGMARSMQEMSKKMVQMEGTPVLIITRMMPGDPQLAAQMEEASRAQSQANANRPSVADQERQAAGQIATQEAAGRMGRFGGLAGGLGGVGGLGKRKPKADAQPAAQQTAAVQPAPQTEDIGSFSSRASMMDIVVEHKNFSTAPVDPSLFEVPAGFKQVDSPMKKALAK